MENNPPKLADRLLSSFIKSELLEEIQGDLYHYYTRNVQAKGRFRSSVIYWYQILHFIRPFAIKRGQNSNFTIMLKYNILIALRNLNKQRFYSLINISGLALAAAACLLITIFIMDEFSYDKHWENHENIYRMSSHIHFNDNDMEFANSPAAMKEALKMDVPEIIESGRFRSSGSILLQKGDQFIKQDNSAWADADLLNIFQLDFIYGSKENALVEAESILLSKTASEKFFGFENPVGKTIVSAEEESFRIDGVFNDIPVNSHFHFDVIRSLESLEHSKNKMWLSNNYKNYFILDENVSVEDLNDKMPLILKTYLEPKLNEIAGVNYDDFYEGGNFLDYHLVPMTDIHLHSHLQLEAEANGSMDNIYIFLAVGIMILLLAAFNFMNLSTAKSTTRAKEVGIRKVMGSLKSSLVGQFLTESIVISLFSFLIAIISIYLALPVFNDFTGKSVSNPLFGEWMLWPYVLLSSMLIGVIAGIYPAFFLSGYKPIQVLKGRLALGTKSSFFRHTLVVFQFSISILMIIGTSVVYKQLMYNQNKNLGYDRNKVMILENTYTLGSGTEAFTNDLLADPDIERVTFSYFLPSRGNRSDNTYNREEDNGVDNAVNMQTWRVDDQYIPTLGMTISEGRNFSREMKTDSSAIIINETAAKILGYHDSAIGKKINYVGETYSFTVIGVIEDFYFDSFKEEVKPLIFFMEESTQSMALRYKSENPMQLLERVEDIWRKHAAGHPFEYTFMDQEFNARFAEDRRLGTILSFFSVLAIIIACLGLFALASYTAEQRKKEISIRKVLGASIPGIMKLLFSSFSRLLFISAIISIPSGYLLMSQWLENFVYRTEVGVVILVVACAVVFAIAWLTVGSQTLNAARVNPADNLHNE